ncbi:MAG: hypothetical protein J6A01_10165, partial [Proteobacteria bacterium]|nr:hypothetical protein [Pseudomonadota bacterium]
MKIRYIMLLVAVVMLSGCDDWQDSKAVKNAKSNLLFACENSGGAYLDYTINDSALGKRCFCSDIACDEGVNCVQSSDGSAICAGQTGSSFEKMCVSSGGEYNQTLNRCQCKKACSKDVYCHNLGGTYENEEQSCVLNNVEIDICKSYYCDRQEDKTFNEDCSVTDYYDEVLQKCKITDKALTNTCGYDDVNRKCYYDIFCDDGVVCDLTTKLCAGTTGDSFEKLCVSSGGTIDSNGSCLCNGSLVACKNGVVCKFSKDKYICEDFLDYCSSSD